MNMKIAYPLALCFLAACTTTPKTADSEGTRASDTLTYSPADRALLDSIQALDGLQRTSSGLRYQVLTAAEGEKPAPEDTILVGYRGLHADGSLFWEDEGEAFCLGGTIQGFQEGVGMMSVGSKYMLYIPSALGYGTKGIPDLIAPDEPLIYEVTLKGVKHPK